MSAAAPSAYIMNSELFRTQDGRPTPAELEAADEVTRAKFRLQCTIKIHSLKNDLATATIRRFLDSFGAVLRVVTGITTGSNFVVVEFWNPKVALACRTALAGESGEALAPKQFEYLFMHNLLHVTHVARKATAPILTDDEKNAKLNYTTGEIETPCVYGLVRRPNGRLELPAEVTLPQSWFTERPTPKELYDAGSDVQNEYLKQCSCVLWWLKPTTADADVRMKLLEPFGGPVRVRRIGKQLEGLMVELFTPEKVALLKARLTKGVTGPNGDVVPHEVVTELFQITSKPTLTPACASIRPSKEHADEDAVFSRGQLSVPCQFGVEGNSNLSSGCTSRGSTPPPPPTSASVHSASNISPVATLRGTPSPAPNNLSSSGEAAGRFTPPPAAPPGRRWSPRPQETTAAAAAPLRTSKNAWRPTRKSSQEEEMVVQGRE